MYVYVCICMYVYVYVCMYVYVCICMYMYMYVYVCICMYMYVCRCNFYSDISMDKHISSVVKTCFHQLREFRHIRSFIPKSAAIIFANAFINSRIDYCNSLFYGLPKYSINR